MHHPFYNRMMLMPALVFIIYMSVACWLLLTGHLHEDAYILMIYANNLANGDGITYFTGAQPAEGATDFLWMVLLALAKFIGADIALAAHAINGAGLSLITWFALDLARAETQSRQSALMGLLLALLLLTSQITMASLAGFSTGFYCAVVAVLFRWIYRRDAQQLCWVPIISLVLGLIRPDGVLIGMTASLIGLFLIAGKPQFRTYLITASGAVLAGLIYLIWRWHYFGEWLPLPLIVKSADSASLPGISGHIAWARHNFYLGVAAIIAFSAMRKRWRVLVASLPVGALLLALMFATQHQNVADRFQAPATTVLILCCAIYLKDLMKLTISACQRFQKKPYVAIVALALTGVAVTGLLSMAVVNYAHTTLNLFNTLRSDEYINTFPYWLSSKQPPATSRFALTEAGRFAYWLPGQKFDLVGLNTAQFAVNPVTPTDIDALRPDLVFIHLADTADLDNHCSQSFCELTLQHVQESLIATYDWSDTQDGVYRAPLAVYAHLRSQPESYQIYAVLYRGSYDHLYLLRKDGSIKVQAFESALAQSFLPSAQLSYWEMRHHFAGKP